MPLEGPDDTEVNLFENIYHLVQLAHTFLLKNCTAYNCSPVKSSVSHKGYLTSDNCYRIVDTCSSNFGSWC